MSTGEVRRKKRGEERRLGESVGEKRQKNGGRGEER